MKIHQLYNFHLSNNEFHILNVFLELESPRCMGDKQFPAETRGDPYSALNVSQRADITYLVFSSSSFFFNILA